MLKYFKRLWICKERKIKNNYTISEYAEEDLLNIFLKSIKNWGSSKALEYSQMIDEAFTQLSENPDMGKSRDELFPGALSFPVGSHLIFYRKTDNQIEIARVLHKRMDYERHFTE